MASDCVCHQVRYETDALRVSLSKIASMLQVGFGEAGNNLIAENLRKGDTVDPMVPGRRLLGAFGFCIIDEYEEVLECLGEEPGNLGNSACTCSPRRPFPFPTGARVPR